MKIKLELLGAEKMVDAIRQAVHEIGDDKLQEALMEAEAETEAADTLPRRPGDEGEEPQKDQGEKDEQKE